MRAKYYGLAAASAALLAGSIALAPSAMAYNHPYEPCYVHSHGIDSYFGGAGVTTPYAAGRIRSMCDNRRQAYAWIDAPFGDSDSGCFAIIGDGAVHTYRYEMRTSLSPFSTAWHWRFCRYSNGREVETTVMVPGEGGDGGGGGW